MKPSISLLDPMRAFAAWAVIAWHLTEYVGYKLPIFRSAAFAVDVFMNISGFLMMYHYVERQSREPWNSPRTWGRFMVRRFFRIAPLYYLVLLIVYGLNIAPPVSGAVGTSAAGVDEGGFGPVTFGGGFLLMHLSFLFGLFPSYTGDNIIPDWSLSLEMQFYLCFPFLALLIARIGSGAFFFVCTLVSATANGLVNFYAGSSAGPLGWYPHPSLLPLKLQVFVVGIVAANVYFKGFGELRSVWYIPGWILFGLTCKHNYARLLGGFYCLLYLLAIMPQTALHLSTFVSRMNFWCERKGWFRWPAELSYSGYLIHGIVLTAVFGWPTAETRSHLVSFPRYASAYLMTLTLVCAIGLVLFRLIEKPGIDAGKRLLKHYLPSR